VPVGLVLAVALGVPTGVRVGLAAGLSVTSQGLTAYRTCTLTATPTTTAAVADASVRQSNPTTRYGSATTDDVATGSGAIRRLYLRFDLTQCKPAIPAAAIVRLATLRLYASVLPPGVCRTVDVFRVTASWTEASITWNGQPFGTAVNNPASASASDTFAIGTGAGCQNRAAGYVVGATVTADVAAFVAGTSANYGWMLRDDVEDSATPYMSTYAAKESGTIAQAPQLVVTYQVVA
jgi:hypothetical protein